MSLRKRTLGRRYQLIEEIGSGGMGTVYRARDTRTGNAVAVKILHPHLTRDPEYVERFRREIEITQSLTSPNIIRVLDFGEDGSDRFFVMEYVNGVSLHKMLRQSDGLPLPQALDIAIQIAAALEEAHAKGVVHRDIKPENIVVTPNGLVKVGDFGIARAQDQTRLTLSGAVMGTVQYMAPELLTGGGDARSDIYSLGVILYQMLVGAPPFEAPTPWEILRKHREEPVPNLDGIESPSGVVAILNRCLSKDPENRFQDAASLSADLAKAASALSTERRVGGQLLQEARGVSAQSRRGERRIALHLPRRYAAVSSVFAVLVVLAGVVAAFFWFDSQGGTSSVALLPTGGGSEVTALSSGAKHTCALKDAGVWCWGGGDNGQLGNGNNINKNVPVAVSELASSVSVLSAGTYHTCAVRDGLWCWGANDFGELGDGTRTSTNAPASVSVLGSGVTVVGAGTAGGAHTCAVREGGAWCWGWNNYGELGDGTRNHSNVPVEVLAMVGGVTDVSAGSGHTCAVKEGGVWCWGFNGSGQLGDGTGGLSTNSNDSWVPVAVVGLTSGVTAVSAGGGHTCAVKDGGVWCWGDNSVGQLGDGATPASNVPVAVLGLESGVRAISAGARHTCALKGGSVSCWGNNEKGKLGNDSTTDSLVPVAVSGLANGITAISAGEAHTCATDGGTVWCWGDNAVGQLGNGSATSSSIPVAVFGFGTGVSAASMPEVGCGKDLSVTIDGPSPIGRTFHAGETLAVTVNYTAPGCTRIYPGIFVGRHDGNTVWARSLCGQDGAFGRDGRPFAPCPSGVQSRVLSRGGAQEISSNGAYALVGDAGSGPAKTLDSRADIDGFELCGFWVGFSDGSVMNAGDLPVAGHGAFYGWDLSGERRDFANPLNFGWTC